ncbi:hypothetical protein RHMOL_Rhmol01G0146000 [Rhododendron molle]|uniref:Uncharacterized protein n=1 Tax=Rhododendron molle TaxID=49168 RepID=A0ACC0Q3F3_RHOML|nr:hypothetical protein RHMOL_Rhmol01G0146000 [Rhododendron molle]
METTHDLDLLTVAGWAATFLEVRIKRRGRIWGEEDAVVSGGNVVVHGNGAAAVTAAATEEAKGNRESATVVAGEVTESVSVVAGEVGGDQVVGAVEGSSGVEVAKLGGGSEAAADVGGAEAASGSGGGATGSCSGAAGTPHTPTMEELLEAAKRAGDEQRGDDGQEVVVGGRVVTTPVLRATVVEPRDVLGAFRLEPDVEAVLRGARTLEDRTSALLIGALLSGAGASDTGGLGVECETEEGEAEEWEPEAATERRVTAVEEVKEYLKGERPGFTIATYTPRLHFFEPTGMTGYVPARDDYPEDMLLRDRASHISSGWTTVSFDNLHSLNFLSDLLLPIASIDTHAISLLC